MKRFISLLYTIILFSTQLLAQWNKVEAINSPIIYSALFKGDNIFVGTDSLYISKNKGATWQVTIPTGEAVEITAIFKTGDLLFLGTYGKGVYLSSNNGDSWQPFNAGLGAYANYGKKFTISGDTVLYATDGGGVYIFKLGSNTWQSYNENLPDKIAWTSNDIAVTNTNIVLSSGASGFYFLRPKGSPQWTEARIQTPNGNYTTPHTFLSIGNIVFSGSRAGIYRSLDNGNTWDSVGIRALPLDAVSFVNDNNRIYAGFTRSTDFFVWYSDDMGETWNSLDHQFHNLISLYIYDNKIWAATTDGLYYNQLQPSTVEPVDIPDKFKLEQNHPNPFNPSTKIGWQTLAGAHQSIIVYDILGNKIATLIDEYRPAGSYEVDFNPTNLASGIYLYRLQVNNFTGAKKMILLR